MLHIHYAPGPAVSDFELEKTYQELKPLIVCDEQHIATYSNELIFLRVRVAVARGEISSNNVLFFYNGQEFEIDSDGRIGYWPDGFLDTTEKLLLELI